MKQMHITLSEDDIDFFERKRIELGMSKSSFVRLLIANYEKAEPNFMKYKEVINAVSDLNNSIKQIIIDNNVNIVDKIYFTEKFEELEELMREKMI